MSTLLKTTSGFALALVVAVVTIPPSYAGNFAKNYPRRAEVLRREHNEVKKNEQAEQSGKITEKQENRLNRKENHVNRERNRMERRNGVKKAKSPVSAPTTAQ